MGSHTAVCTVVTPRKLAFEPLARLYNAIDQDSTVPSLKTPLFYYTSDEAPLVSCAILPYAPDSQLPLVLRLTQDALAWACTVESVRVWSLTWRGGHDAS